MPDELEDAPPASSNQQSTPRIRTNPSPDMNQGTLAVSRQNRVFIGISVVLYLIACATPCLEVSQKSDPVWLGLQILVMGWLGILVGQFAWLANPLWLAGLLFFAFRKWMAALILSGLALVFALNTFTMFVTELPADEGGMNTFHLVRLRIGFYLWLASLAVPFARAFVMRMQSRQQRI